MDKKEIKQVDIVFENCEVGVVPIDCIEKLIVSDISESFSLDSSDKLSRDMSCKEAVLLLNKKGMELSIVDIFYQEELLIDRLQRMDVTHLDIIFTDDTNLYITVPWGEEEWHNTKMFFDRKEDEAFIIFKENFDVNKIKEEINDYCGIKKSEKPEFEMGQLMFSPNKLQSYVVPNMVIAALKLIDEKLSNAMQNLNQEEYESPFSNTGDDYKNNCFEVQAYNWNEDIEQPFNFRWRDYEISWYKYLGRGMSANREISNDEIAQMLDECLSSIEKYIEHDE